MPKVSLGEISEHVDHNENEHRASLEKGNVDAESVRKRRRPKAGREASNANNVGCHRGIGDGMDAREQRVNTGSPQRWGERPRLGIREDQTRPRRVTERSVVAKKRVTIVERRDLSSRAMQEAARAGRLT
jgi:hypothetical protein